MLDHASICRQLEVIFFTCFSGISGSPEGSSSSKGFRDSAKGLEGDIGVEDGEITD